MPRNTDTNNLKLPNHETDPVPGGVRIYKKPDTAKPYQPVTDPDVLLTKNYKGDHIVEQSARLKALETFAEQKNYKKAVQAARTITANELAVNQVLSRLPHTDEVYDLAEELAWREQDPFRRDPIIETIEKSRAADERIAQELEPDLSAIIQVAESHAGTIGAHGSNQDLPQHQKPAV